MVYLDIPIIICLDILKSHSLLVNYLDNRLEYRNLKYSRPLTFKRGHVFLEWNHDAILFTRTELTRMQLHFMHPAADRLFELIKRASPAHATDSVKELLSEINTACQSCKECKSRLLRFDASISPSQLVFNQSISIELLLLDEKPVLHVIDDRNNYWNAIFLRSKKEDHVWSAFVSCWASTNIGFPDKIRCYQESGVASKEFRDLSTAQGMHL